MDCELRDVSAKTEELALLMENLAAYSIDSNLLSATINEVSGMSIEANQVISEIISYISGSVIRDIPQNTLTLRKYSYQTQVFLSDSLSEDLMSKISCGSKELVTYITPEQSVKIVNLLKVLQDLTDTIFNSVSTIETTTNEIITQLSSKIAESDDSDESTFIKTLRTISNKSIIPDLTKIRDEAINLTKRVVRLRTLINDQLAWNESSNMNGIPDSETLSAARAEKAYQHIILLLKQNSLFDAEDECYRFIKAFKNNSHVRDCNYWIAEITYQRGMMNKAYEFFEKYVSESSKYDHRMGSALVKMINALIKTGNIKAACKRLAFTNMNDLPRYIVRQMKEQIKEANCIE